MLLPLHVLSTDNNIHKQLIAIVNRVRAKVLTRNDDLMENYRNLIKNILLKLFIVGN